MRRKKKGHGVYQIVGWGRPLGPSLAGSILRKKNYILLGKLGIPINLVPGRWHPKIFEAHFGHSVGSISNKVMIYMCFD